MEILILCKEKTVEVVASALAKELKMLSIALGVTVR